MSLRIFTRGFKQEAKRTLARMLDDEKCSFKTGK